MAKKKRTQENNKGSGGAAWIFIILAYFIGRGYIDPSTSTPIQSQASVAVASPKSTRTPIPTVALKFTSVSASTKTVARDNVKNVIAVVATSTKTPSPTKTPTATSTRKPTNTLVATLEYGAKPIEPKVYYALGNSNARACPQTSCAVVDVLYRGAEVEVDAFAEGTAVSGSKQWYRGLYNGELVFVHSSLLSTSKPSAIVVAPATGGNTTNNSSTSNLPENTSVPPTETVGSGCPGFSYTCSQLTCAQAYACLAAGNKQLDRDGDGKPCETQCGG